MSNQDCEHKRIIQAVRRVPPSFISWSHLHCLQCTPVSIARAVELNEAVPPLNIGYPEGGFVRYDDSINSWRYELDHDTESVFWLLLY
jgi:hypothetical protein